MQSYLSRKKARLQLNTLGLIKASTVRWAHSVVSPHSREELVGPEIGLVGSVGGPWGEANGEPASGGLRDDQLWEISRELATRKMSRQIARLQVQVDF